MHTAPNLSHADQRSRTHPTKPPGESSRRTSRLPRRGSKEGPFLPRKESCQRTAWLSFFGRSRYELEQGSGIETPQLCWVRYEEHQRNVGIVSNVARVRERERTNCSCEFSSKTLLGDVSQFPWITPYQSQTSKASWWWKIDPLFDAYQALGRYWKTAVTNDTDNDGEDGSGRMQPNAEFDPTSGTKTVPFSFSHPTHGS